MDESLKVILTKHWPTLVRYINPTPHLIDILVEDRVLPAAMIDDVKRGANRRDKNEILLKSIKLRGNTSYRKFRDAMMKCGQIFIADLLFEEEGAMSFLEESDFTGFPALKLSLSPAALKQFVLFLDAKVRARVLKNEWKMESTKRLDLLLTRAEDNKSQTQAHISAVEKDEKIRQLCAEINVKNDIIRSLSLDINILNAEVESFTERYTSNAKLLDSSDGPFNNSNTPTTEDRTGTPSTHSPAATPRSGSQCGQRGSATPDRLALTPTQGNGSQTRKYPPRFNFFDKALAMVNSKLTTILGLPSASSDEVTRIDLIQGRASQIQELVSRLEDSLRRSNRDREMALSLLLPDSQQTYSSAVTGVQRYLLQEQRHRYALLKDVDRLSRKLRGMSKSSPSSGLHALRQSAVTGKPPAEIVDYRFLSNHIALVEADAVHIHKRLDWKDADVKSLQAEVAHLRKNTTAVK